MFRARRQLDVFGWKPYVSELQETYRNDTAGVNAVRARYAMFSDSCMSSQALQTHNREPPTKGIPMSTWVWIIIIVVIVLAIAGYFGRGRLSR